MESPRVVIYDVIVHLGVGTRIPSFQGGSADSCEEVNKTCLEWFSLLYLVFVIFFLHFQTPTGVLWRTTTQHFNPTQVNWIKKTNWETRISLFMPSETRASFEQSPTHTHRNTEEWQSLPPGRGLPSLAVVVISAKLLSGSILHPHTHTVVCLRAGQPLAKGQRVVTHTREQCCCWQSGPPHYCPCHLRHTQKTCSVTETLWLKLGRRLLSICLFICSQVILFVVLFLLWLQALHPTKTFFISICAVHAYIVKCTM